MFILCLSFAVFTVAAVIVVLTEAFALGMYFYLTYVCDDMFFLYSPDY